MLLDEQIRQIPGVTYLVIRPFQLGDLLLIQRLGRQSAKLNIIQSLLQPRPALTIALGAILPWAGGRTNTYILRQQKNSLAHAGFIQGNIRPGRPEADITFLSPGLDTNWGHPAIWEKLLTHFVHDAALQQVQRVYADVPDQPLPVQSFSQSGFKIYTRQTIWRLNRRNAGFTNLSPEFENQYKIRPILSGDEWPLWRLYYRVTPKEVQLAEGVHQNTNHPSPNGPNSENGVAVRPLILDWWQSSHSNSYVLIDNGEVDGCILIGRGQAGYWLRLLVDTSRPDTSRIHALIHHALTLIDAANTTQPIYIGVRSYHGGMKPILTDYGFAPFTDIARMVRHLPQWVRQSLLAPKPLLKPVPGAVPTSYIFPKSPSGVSQTARNMTESTVNN